MCGFYYKGCESRGNEKNESPCERAFRSMYIKLGLDFISQHAECLTGDYVDCLVFEYHKTEYATQHGREHLGIMDRE